MNQLSKLSDISHARVADNAGASEWWTAERIAQLRGLVSSGATYPAIAAQMGTTKAAISGKVYRLGIVSNRKAVSVLRPEPITFAEMSREDCRFPFGDPKHKDFHFCGQPAVPGKPYCETHCALCYVPGSTKAAA